MDNIIGEFSKVVESRVGKDYDYQIKDYTAVIKDGKVNFSNIKLEGKYKKIARHKISFSEYVVVAVLNPSLGDCAAFAPFVRFLSSKYSKVIVFATEENKAIFEDYSEVIPAHHLTQSIVLDSESLPLKYYALSFRKGPILEVNEEKVKPDYLVDLKGGTGEKNGTEPKTYMFDDVKKLFEIEGKKISTHNLYDEEHSRKRKNQALVCLASRSENKDLSSETQISIIQYLIKLDIKVILVGNSEKEIKVAKRIHDKIPHVENKAGKTSLKELMNLIKESMLVIGPDTGTMHLADAFNTNTITLFGQATHSSGYAHLLPYSIDLDFKDIKNPDMGLIYKSIDKLIESLNGKLFK